MLPPDIPYTMTLFMTGGPKDVPSPDADTAQRVLAEMAADTAAAVV